jgi:hypothetical protein
MTIAAHRALAREFSWMLAALGGRLVASDVKDWSSGALTGARHAFVFDCAERVPPLRAQRMASQIASREFALIEGFVADARLISDNGVLSPNNRVRIEALTLAA